MRLLIRVFTGLVVLALPPAPGWAATDLGAMRTPEIEALQHRLADAGCYKAEIDGRASPAMVAAVKACPDQSPMLRIETGMHVAQISRLAVDSGCRLMATASDDKTLRLWSLPEGRLLRTIRLPIDDGDTGKVYAVALSPDRHTIAAGGFTGQWDKGKPLSIYIIDSASGAMQRYGDYGSVTNHLAFSADGARLGIALGSNKGVRVLDPSSGRELMSDQDYGSDAYGLAFGPDGSLVTTSYDGFLRRYGPDLTLTAKVRAPGGARPYGIAVDPSGRWVSVGYADTTAVSILDAATLKHVTRAETADVKTDNFEIVAWTADGRELLAGGEASKSVDGHWYRFVRRFAPNGRRLGKDIAVSDNTIMDLEPCAGDVVFTAADPSFGLLGPDGRARVLQGPVTADMRDKVGATAFMASADAGTVRFGLGDGAERPALFDLSAGTLTDSPNPPAGLAAPSMAGLRITDWKNNIAPKVDGALIPLQQYEVSRSLALRLDREGFVLGTDWSLRSFDAAGRQRWSRPVPSNTWGVDLSQDGSIVVAAYGDGTIRWHRWSDGQELLALFANRNTRAWVAWTPTGYYMASAGAEDLIGWHVNRGWEQEADFFPASRFRDKFNRPDIVQTILQTRDEGEAVKQANAAAKRRDDQTPIIERLPPVITIVSPSDGAGVASGMVEIRYQTRTPSGGKVDRVEAFVDGAKIQARGLGPASGATPSPDGSTAVTLPMPDHDAVISLVAYADGQASNAARIELKGTAPAGAGASADPDASLKPTLYALLIGVTHYEAKAYDLAYPAQDALGLAEALQSQKGKLYKDVVVKVLIDGEATSTAVKRGLTWLRKQTTAHDLAIVFAAGHGTTDAKGKFWFLTHDMDPDDISATAVSRDDISDVLFDLPGKKLLFLDACHSGAALNAGARGESDISLAISDFAQTEGGVVAYAASTGREFSFERPEWGHGAFTKALIEGFSGKADILHKGTVTTASLDLFLENRVKELTGGLQHPVMTRPTTVPDFPIATVQ